MPYVSGKENVVFCLAQEGSLWYLDNNILYKGEILEMPTDEIKVKHTALKRERGDKFFVLADIHAFYKPMMRALKEKGFDRDDPRHKVILLGDMLDRGDAAKETFGFFAGLGDRLTYVRGNHEDLFIRCLEQFLLGQKPNMAHFLNGTVETMMQFLGEPSFEKFEWIFDAGDTRRILRFANNIEYAVSSVVEFIESKSVDYATLDDFVFVHGYIPCDHFKATDKYFPISDWKNGDWYASRWAHGTKAWHDGVRLQDKTIVCGHWNAREANRLYHGSVGEDGNGDNMPFIDDGIIAMDADTFNSGICNCIVL